MVIHPIEPKNYLPEEQMIGDGWIGFSLTNEWLYSGNPSWKTDRWSGYEQMLAEYINPEIGKENTQRLERANGILSQPKALASTATQI